MLYLLTKTLFKYIDQKINLILTENYLNTDHIN